mgnify:CR=1 FL=1
MSAEERRESVIRAAMSEFARGGYHGTSTEAIAKRVGVSQPYLFRLFPGKKAIFLAASARCLEDTRKVFEKASEGLHGEEALLGIAIFTVFYVVCLSVTWFVYRRPAAEIAAPAGAFCKA